MKPLEYVWSDGIYTKIEKYAINENGVVTNVHTGKVLTRHRIGKYNIVTILHEGRQRYIRVARAIASTFIGPPPTIRHTADHIDKNSFNDVLKNIRWLDKKGQTENRTTPSDLKTAFIIEKNGEEHTVKEWAEVFKKPTGEKYTISAIQKYAQQQRFGFKYKTFPNLRREVWKVVKDSKNNKGEWFISSRSRMKYKTSHAENVLTADQLCKDGGYPMVRINRKMYPCHELAFMTFRPNEYSTKTDAEMILHKADDKLDFCPFRLRLGTRSDNSTDAYDNGKFDNTKTARKPIVSYVNGVFEKEHESICIAIRYLKGINYSKAGRGNVQRALRKGSLAYGRTWKQ
jgi:hypothetical protein